MGRINSRSKGIRGERDVIDLLQPIVTKCTLLLSSSNNSTNCANIRLQRNTMQADGGGAKGNADIAGLDWLSLEVKNCATLQVEEWWKQCETACRNNHKQQEAVLIYKAGRGKWRVRMKGIIGFSVTETRCACDIALSDFLLWFEKRVMEWLAETPDLKRGSPRPANPSPTKAPNVATKPNPLPLPTVAISQPHDGTQGYGYSEPESEIPPAPASPVADMSLAEQMRAAVAWAKGKGYPIPKAGSVERADMFNYWLQLALNGEA